MSQEFSWDGKSCFLPGLYVGLENLKPKNPRHTKVIRSFLMVLMLPGLSSPPAQVSLWLGNCNLALKSMLSSPVPHGKWFCPQRTEQTSVWFPGKTEILSKGSWTRASGQWGFALQSCIFRGHLGRGREVWAPCSPSVQQHESDHSSFQSHSNAPWVNSPCHCSGWCRVPTDDRELINLVIACAGIALGLPHSFGWLGWVLLVLSPPV